MKLPKKKNKKKIQTCRSASSWSSRLKTVQNQKWRTKLKFVWYEKCLLFWVFDELSPLTTNPSSCGFLGFFSSSLLWGLTIHHERPTTGLLLLLRFIRKKGSRKQIELASSQSLFLHEAMQYRPPISLYSNNYVYETLMQQNWASSEARIRSEFYVI